MRQPSLPQHQNRRPDKSVWNRFLLCRMPVLLFIIFVLLFGKAATGQEREAAGADAPAASAETGEPLVISQENLHQLVQTLESQPERKAFIQKLKALAAAAGRREAVQPGAKAPPEQGLVDKTGSWFAGKFRALQRMTRSPEGLVKLLKRGFLSLLIIFFAGLAWFYLHRKLYARIAFGFPVRLLFNSVIGVTGILLLLQAWGMDPAALIMSPFGRGVAGSVLTVAAILIAGLAVWEVVNAYITKRANALDASSDSERRAQTLFPLLRNIARVVIIVVCTLIILPELGINIAPLVAGAGIAGIAIGFGAQTLVKDLINGFLILVENAINIGDWVILGGHDGQVEGMTIRNVRLRDIYGNVSMVPWSSVETVTNQTKSFGYAVVEPGVAYRENIDEVIGVVKQVAAEMRADPAISRDILSDLQILGLIELGDSAVVVRTRFKTTPFKRWFLERDFRRRLKNRFDELGIEIPFPHSTIYFGENKSGTAPPARINIEKDAT